MTDREISFHIRGAAMEVYNTLGPGLLESIYHKALKHELEARGLNVASEMPVEVYYKGVLIEENAMRLDIIVEDRVIVELKSVSELTPAHRAQLFNYLRLTKKPIGLLINFGQSYLQGERYAYCEYSNECLLLDRNMDVINEK